VENDGFMGELYIAYGQNGDRVGVISLVVLLKLSLLAIICPFAALPVGVF
jgi:hypothetical protein